MRSSGESALRTTPGAEAQELTSIGNSHPIRRSGVNQVPVIDADQVDYLFHRVFAMILLMLNKK